MDNRLYSLDASSCISSIRISQSGKTVPVGHVFCLHCFCPFVFSIIIIINIIIIIIIIINRFFPTWFCELLAFVWPGLSHRSIHLQQRHALSFGPCIDDGRRAD
ncbi:hypothetical protein V6Z77_007791 [Aspergillus fumigatus]